LRARYPEPQWLSFFLAKEMMLEYNNTIIGYNTLFSSRLVHVKFSNLCGEGFLSMNVKNEPVRASTNSRPQVKNTRP